MELKIPNFIRNSNVIFIIKIKNTLKEVDLEKLSLLKVKLCIDSFGFE